MRNPILILLVIGFLISCGDNTKNNSQSSFKCKKNNTTIEHDSFVLNFCLPNYLSSYRKDTSFEGYQPGTKTEYNYSLTENPIVDNGFLKLMKNEDSLYVNFCVAVEEGIDFTYLQSDKRSPMDNLTRKRNAISQIDVLDSLISENEKFIIYNLETIGTLGVRGDKNHYQYERLYFIKNTNYIFSFLFEIRFENQGSNRYRNDVLNIMKSIKITPVD